MTVQDQTGIDHGSGEILIAYASQSGTAERKARNAALALHQGGVRAEVMSIGKLTAEKLAEARRVLFVVSSYGNGEPPDMARGFYYRVPPMRLDLGHIHYGVLALGNAGYPDFCGFGRKIEGWLNRSGAKPLFDTITMDREAPEADELWQDRLRELGASDATRGLPNLPFLPWKLVAREALNPGNSHQTAFHLRFEPAGTHEIRWEAGDIVEVHVGKATASLPLPMREYSAASIPADGTLDLVVRQVRRDDGQLGLGSGWLTDRTEPGGSVDLRVRPNPGFRMPVNGRPLILIGNGTGMAGLRAHLRQQAHDGGKGHWLLFGERNRVHEAFFDEELTGWQADGTLARIDRAFSRDADCGRYVQHLLEEAREEIAAWMERGAVILVCGSLNGMAEAVHSVLADIVGDSTTLDRLSELGRYKRDVY